MGTNSAGFAVVTGASSGIGLERRADKDAKAAAPEPQR
jgi:short-subunit dehydrogenase